MADDEVQFLQNVAPRQLEPLTVTRLQSVSLQFPPRYLLLQFVLVDQCQIQQFALLLHRVIFLKYNHTSEITIELVWWQSK